MSQTFLFSPRQSWLSPGSLLQLLLCTYAVKSADAVAAVDASWLSFACHTAPLWPMNVPILVGTGQSRFSDGYRVRGKLVPISSLSITKHGVVVCAVVSGRLKTSDAAGWRGWSSPLQAEIM